MIRLTNVEKTYEHGTEAVRGISRQIDDGEFVFLVGPSVSGKSTLIKMLTAEVRPTAGRVQINGFNTNRLSRRQVPLLRRTIGVIFQDFRLIEKKTVYENLEFVMRSVGASAGEIRKRIPSVLDLVALSGKEDRYPDELSGGEQQRVAIARALINNPVMIIADEPTGNLDPARSFEIMSLLERINTLGTTVVVVTHERTLVDRFNKRVIKLEQGRIVSDRYGQYNGNKPVSATGKLPKVDGATGVLPKVDSATGVLPKMDHATGVLPKVDGATGVLPKVQAAASAAEAPAEPAKAETGTLPKRDFFSEALARAEEQFMAETGVLPVIRTEKKDGEVTE